MPSDLAQELLVLLRRADAARIRSVRLTARAREAVEVSRATSDSSSRLRSARWRSRYEVAYKAHLRRLPDLDQFAS